VNHLDLIIFRSQSQLCLPLRNRLHLPSSHISLNPSLYFTSSHLGFNTTKPSTYRLVGSTFRDPLYLFASTLPYSTGNVHDRPYSTDGCMFFITKRPSLQSNTHIDKELTSSSHGRSSPLFAMHIRVSYYSTLWWLQR
jgi:hypothetical protein